MNVLDATRAWMRAQCPLINRQDLFNANYLGAEPTEYTLRTASESTHNYPAVSGYRVTKITASNAGVPTGADANAARYQLQIKLYLEEE